MQGRRFSVSLIFQSVQEKVFLNTRGGSEPARVFLRVLQTENRMENPLIVQELCLLLHG